MCYFILGNKLYYVIASFLENQLFLFPEKELPIRVKPTFMDLTGHIIEVRPYVNVFSFIPVSFPASLQCSQHVTQTTQSV